METAKLKILLSLLNWFHNKYFDGRSGGEAGSTITTVKDIIEMYIRDKWRQK